MPEITVVSQEICFRCNEEGPVARLNAQLEAETQGGILPEGLLYFHLRGYHQAYIDHWECCVMVSAEGHEGIGKWVDQILTNHPNLQLG